MGIRIRVLIADDHTLVAEALRLVIDAEPDLEVVACAANGQEAVGQCLAKRPDVVVMDYAMPGMGGVEATEILRRRCSAMRVLMRGMNGDQLYVMRALRAGAAGYLLKKSVPQELLDAIRCVRDGHTYLAHELTADCVQEPKDTALHPLERLSRRERQVFRMVAEGTSTSSIARHLSVSVKTVETYRARMMHKLDVRDVAAIVKLALRHGVITLEG